MDELKEKYGAQLTVMFHPIDFPNIPGFPNCCNGLGDAYVDVFVTLECIHLYILCIVP